MRTIEITILPCRARSLAMFIWEMFISPWWDPKLIDIPLRRAGSLNTCFYRGFLKKVRFSLGEPAHLAGPSHLYIKSSSVNFNELPPDMVAL